MTKLGHSAAKLLGRLAINPSARQSQLASDLGITRSAVNQMWKKLQQENNLSIQGNLDYGLVGMRLIYGWVIDDAIPKTLKKFSNWIQRNPYSLLVYESLLTSSNDSRVFFECIIPSGSPFNEFIGRLRAFEKAPYNLKVYFEHTIELGNHLNMGLYNGSNWQFDTGFKLEASIDGARPYAEILPISNAIYQTTPIKVSLENLIIVSVLEKDYFANWRRLNEQFKTFKLKAPSQRTLRRRLMEYREHVVKPKINIENIGLSKSIIVTLTERSTSDLFKLIRAQSVLFPQVRILSGRSSIVMILNLPETSDWLPISNTMSNIVGSSMNMCTFIAEQLPNRKWLENIALKMVRRNESR